MTQEQTENYGLWKYTFDSGGKVAQGFTRKINGNWDVLDKVIGGSDIPDALGFENGETGTLTVPKGWHPQFDGGLGSYQTETPPNSEYGSTQSYGTTAYYNSDGTGMSWWKIHRYYAVTNPGNTLDVSCKSAIVANPPSTIDYTEGSSCWFGEDDSFIEVVPYDASGRGLSIPTADRYSETTSHQEWERNGAFNTSGQEWYPLSHSLTLPSDTRYVRVSYVSSEASESVQGLGHLGPNSGTLVDDVSIDYPDGGLQVVDPVEIPAVLSGRLGTTQSSVEGGTYINVFEVVPVSHAPVTRDSNSQITFNEAGLYRVDFTVNFHRTGSGARNIMFAQIEHNGNFLASRSRGVCYIRHDGNGDEGDATASTILDVSAGDTLRIHADEERGGETGNDVERAYINIERVEA